MASLISSSITDTNPKEPDREIRKESLVNLILLGISININVSWIIIFNVILP